MVGMVVDEINLELSDLSDMFPVVLATNELDEGQKRKRSDSNYEENEENESVNDNVIKV